MRDTIVLGPYEVPLSFGNSLYPGHAWITEKGAHSIPLTAPVFLQSELNKEICISVFTQFYAHTYTHMRIYRCMHISIYMIYMCMGVCVEGIHILLLGVQS